MQIQQRRMTEEIAFHKTERQQKVFITSISFMCDSKHDVDLVGFDNKF